MYKFSPPPQLVVPNVATFTPMEHNSLPLHSCANISVTYFPQEGKVDNRVFDGLQAWSPYIDMTITISWLAEQYASAFAFPWQNPSHHVLTAFKINVIS